MVGSMAARRSTATADSDSAKSAVEKTAAASPEKLPAKKRAAAPTKPSPSAAAEKSTAGGSGSKPVKRTEKQAAAAEEATEATAMPSPPARVNKPEARKAPPAKDNKFPLWIVLVGALVVVGGMWMLMSAPAGGKVGGKGPVKKDTVKSGAMLERREKLKGSVPWPRCVNTASCKRCCARSMWQWW